MFFLNRFMQLIGVVSSDPSVLARMGELHDNEGDKSLAFQYYFDVSSQFLVKRIHEVPNERMQSILIFWSFGAELMDFICHLNSRKAKQFFFIIIFYIIKFDVVWTNLVFQGTNYHLNT